MKFGHNDQPTNGPSNGVPGDIKVKHWSEGKYEDVYMDVVVANIFAPSYIGITSEKRGALAKQKEMEKKKKYNDSEQMLPLAIEVLGGMGIIFKKVLQRIAHRICTRKNKVYSEMMNQLRQYLVARLMQQNTNMILSSLEL